MTYYVTLVYNIKDGKQTGLNFILIYLIALKWKKKIQGIHKLPWTGKL